MLTGPSIRPASSRSPWQTHGCNRAPHKHGSGGSPLAVRTVAPQRAGTREGRQGRAIAYRRQDTGAASHAWPVEVRLVEIRGSCAPGGRINQRNRNQLAASARSRHIRRHEACHSGIGYQRACLGQSAGIDRHHRPWGFVAPAGFGEASSMRRQNSDAMHRYSNAFCAFSSLPCVCASGFRTPFA